MTIDEMKDWLITLKPEELKEHYTDNAIKLVMEARDMAIGIIDWCREQDLIRREDVIDGCYCDKGQFCFDDDCDNCYDIAIDRDRIEQISKAEPTSSKMEQVAKNATTTNGDCETCKHYDETCCNKCGDGVDYYEPYIPNPIEKEFIVHNKEDWDRFIADIDKE